MLESEPSSVTPRALAEVDRLERTVEHLLALSRDRPTGENDIDLAATVRAAKERWAPVVSARHRVLQVTIDTNVATVRASATATAQVIDVLIDNALTHGAGTIQLNYRRTAGAVAVDVVDNGPGIGLDETEQIFRRRHGTGHGIGLALARSLAGADGGRLLLTSNKPPRFTLFVPTTARPGRGQASADRAVPADGGENVDVVDRDQLGRGDVSAGVSETGTRRQAVSPAD
jgi:signal transduction histidine kinase